MDEWNADDFPLPEWAVGRSDGNYLQVGAQLATRDGRRCGNAYVDDSNGRDAVVVTDMGSVLHVNIKELEELFHPPSYIMDVREARARRGVSTREE